MERRPRLAVDGIIVKDGKVLLIERDDGLGRALPGGMVEYGETTEDALKRELREETGLEVEVGELFGVYSDPDRDKRWHIITVAYVCRPKGGKLRAGDDAKSVGWVELENVGKLAFDHNQIIADFLSARSRPVAGSG